MELKLKIPTSLEDITIEQFVRYNRALKLDINDEDVMLVSTVACFCNISVDDAIKIDYKELKEIGNKILEVLSQEPRDIQKYKNFGRIPNLDNITAGEYIDLDKYFSDSETYGRAMAVMFRPITKSMLGEYVIESYESSEKYEKDTLQFPLEVLLSTLVFFCNLSKDLLKATRDYLQQPTTEVDELAKLLEVNGVGINQFIQSLQETISTLTELQKPTYTSF